MSNHCANHISEALSKSVVRILLTSRCGIRFYGYPRSEKPHEAEINNIRL